MIGCGPVLQRGIKRTLGPGNNMCYEPTDHHRLVDDNFSPPSIKDVSPSNGKKTKGRVKIKMEYIENKLRRYTTFSKRKTGIMKKVSQQNLFNIAYIAYGLLVVVAVDSG
jgi:hypothetical protein